MKKANIYKIEKNIPVSKINGWSIKYPFRDMEILDSFFVPCLDEEKRQRLRNSIYRSAHQYARLKERTFRIIIRSGDKGIRVWRKC